MAMGQMISPGVYTRIIDLSEYLADIPGTIGFLPILSRRGPDNKLYLCNSKEQFINLYGEPNILDYGKAYGQGPYVAWQHLGVSSQLYVLRALPSDATYSHLAIGMQLIDVTVNGQYSSSEHGIPFTRLDMYPMYMDGLVHPWKDSGGHQQGEDAYPTINHIKDLETLFFEETTAATYMHKDYTDSVTGDGPNSTGGTGVPNGILMYFRTIGRGSSYNDFSIRLTKNANTELFGVYVLDIYDTDAQGDKIITESYNVSFDPDMVDDGGESIFIQDVVNKFSRHVRVSVNMEALRQLETYKMDFYKNDPTLPDTVTEYTVLDENGQKTDLGYKATMIEFAKMDYDYAVYMLNQALDNLATARKLPSSTQQEIIDRNEAISAALSDVSQQRVIVAETKVTLEEAYGLDIMDFGDADPNSVGMQPWPLQCGSEGSLVYEDKTTGKKIVQPEEATQALAQAYLGLLVKPDDPAKIDPVSGSHIWPRTQYVDEVFDLDWIYFSLVYDAGYPIDVKSCARELAAVYRMDCMLISDCGDNIDYYDVEAAVGANPNETSGSIWNTKYAARYEPYSRIYDAFTGRDLWITPVYHMAQLIPLNDRLYEIWYASAGFNRATLDSIKELRWSAKLGERDNLYLLQVNPIVHFPQGYTVWGNLTTQKRPTALQDINCMRLVLYIKRALEQFCKYFIFEFNDQVTWNQIKKGIIPFLDNIKGRRGLVDFTVDVGANEWEFKNKICHVNVTLTPMKVIEKIELNLYVK